MGSATETMESGQQATGNGKATNPSLADDVYQLAVPEEVATVLDRSPALGAGLNQQPAGARTPQQQTAATIEATPVVISFGNRPEASSSVAAGAPPVSTPAAAAPAETANAEPGAALRDSGAAPQPAPKVTTLRPRRRRRRIRLLYLMQAWSVSLVVHVAILSALAWATFKSDDPLKKTINFDSALASHRAGEQELLPIYADPDNVPRDQAIGDEHASEPGEPAMVVVGEGGDSDSGGGVIVAGGLGTGRPTSTPRVRGAGKGRINEGSSLPGVKIDGLSGSPLTLLPAAPAADLGGGGRIAGDPIFDVQEIGVALDQLAREILRHLKDHKLTVIWLFDESVSMQDDQRTIIQKFDRVSSELKQHIEPSKKSAGALNHAIVGFGLGREFVLEKPRDDIDQIAWSIKKLKIDPTGVENTMKVIREVAEHYANLVRKDRRVLMVLVTDESGDDGADVEEARQALKRNHIPLYVIGRQSLFGYPFAHHRYEDPVTHDVYHPLIRRGPETADVEIYQWDGLYDRWDEQPSGFAPYELARLTKESGGIYFVLPSEEFMRIRHREQAYSITRLKEYLPEYDNRLTYVGNRSSSPLRQTLHAIVLEGKNLLYRRDFPIDHQELAKAALEEGEKATAKLGTLIEIQQRLEALRRARDREPEKRWQAHYDLTLAQTVAFQVKAYEYRALMSAIMQAPPTPKNPQGPDLIVTWVVDHAKKPLAPHNETAKKYAEAERLLKEVIVRHPKTPWADLAQDTLDRGFSVALNEWHHNAKYYDRWQYVPKY
jgi:hypothetical protein